MVINNKLKTGFSLAEALISMLVISVFFLATSKVMTQRQPDDVIWHSHGFCACYQQGGTKLDCSVNGSNVTTKTMNTSQCKIKLPRNATMYNIAIIRSNGVYENEQFINEEAILSPSGTIRIDGVDITNQFMNLAQDHQTSFQLYKELLKNFEPKATFINNTSNAVFINW